MCTFRGRGLEQYGASCVNWELLGHTARRDSYPWTASHSGQRYPKTKRLQWVAADCSEPKSSRGSRAEWQRSHRAEWCHRERCEMSHAGHDGTMRGVWTLDKNQPEAEDSEGEGVREALPGHGDQRRLNSEMGRPGDSSSGSHKKLREQGPHGQGGECRERDAHALLQQLAALPGAAVLLRLGLPKGCSREASLRPWEARVLEGVATKWQP
ncbi:hypothetical protein NDU88_003808 [Pleurodeles waltl]|uniref:Uncharacterized protein n=1 Tax=Pleurodeles waltl TaxID=8319 RepID=A0AAV7SH11_PLEWA|nr:hypothetical protein NDU88_003808 [Pleurodeles waltl]